MTNNNQDLDRSREIRERAESIAGYFVPSSHDASYWAKERKELADKIEQALQSERELALRDAARELNCPDIEYWKPREAVKLVLSLLPSSQTTTTPVNGRNKGDKGK